MHKTINGWTKAKMIEKIRSRPFVEAASDGNRCMYRSPDGNKCAVGVFIPDEMYSGEMDNTAIGDVTITGVLRRFPDLSDVLPLRGAGLICMQNVHDACTGPLSERTDATKALIEFVENHVEDGE